MELIRGLHNLSSATVPCVATIGNFDGVHRGHQAVLEEVHRRSLDLGIISTVIIFEPQPKEYFIPDCSIPRLTNLREKCFYLNQTDIDRVLCLPFNEQLARVSAKDFIEKILLGMLGVRHLFVGHDFHFGYQRQGNVALLQDMAGGLGYQVSDIPTVEVDQQRISSTLIRETLQAGDLAQAKVYLGRDYAIHGRVVKGDQRGRSIGFPTANIPLKRDVCAIEGVFAVQVKGLDKIYRGVANLGSRPTVGGSKQLLEVHLFDFSSEIYGAHVQVDLLHKIRPEQRFASFELLRQQIEKDTQQAKAFFNGRVT